MFDPPTTANALLPSLSEGNHRRANLRLPLSHYLGCLVRSHKALVFGFLGVGLAALSLWLLAAGDDLQPRFWVIMPFVVLILASTARRYFQRPPWVGHLERANVVVDPESLLILNPGAAEPQRTAKKAALVVRGEALIEESWKMPAAVLRAASTDERNIRHKPFIAKKVLYPTLTSTGRLKVIAMGAIGGAVGTLAFIEDGSPVLLTIPMALVGAIGTAAVLTIAKRRNRPCSVETEQHRCTFWYGNAPRGEMKMADIAYLRTALPLGDHDVLVRYLDGSGLALPPFAAHPDILKALIDHPEFMRGIEGKPTGITNDSAQAPHRYNSPEISWGG